MDGFNAIPIQNNSFSAGGFASAPTSDSKSNYNSSYVNSPGQNIGNLNTDIEIIDETKVANKKASFGFLFPLSVLCLLCVFAYFGYLFFLRWTTLQKLSFLSEDFTTLSRNLNKEEMENFIILDSSLKAIKEKLANHTQLSNILVFVNKNIRSSVQITDYRIESREKEVNVSLASLAPSFKELAEQTEKMNQLKSEGALKDFNVTQMSLEADGRRIRYTLNLIFDKTKVVINNTN